MDHDITGIAGWAVDLMDSLGLVGAALAVGIENFFPPIPSELILPMAGFAAAQGVFSLPGALLATTAGSVIGAMALYWLGLGFGRNRVARIFEITPLLRLDDLERTEKWFARHGGKAVFLGRMVPIFRTLISIPAGVERMSFWRFSLLTISGSLIWNSVFVIAGYRLGENWQEIEPYANAFQTVVLAVVGLTVAVFVLMRIRARN